MAIPTYERQLKPSPIPGARVTAHGGADAYGAGVARAASGLVAEIDKLRQEKDYARALQAANEFQRRVDVLHRDPDDGLLVTRVGGLADGLADHADAEMKKIAAEIGGKLSSPLAQKAYAEHTQRIFNAQSRSNMHFEQNEIKKYMEAETDASINGAYRSIAMNADDEEAIEEERQRILDAMEYKLRGAGTQARDAALLEVESSIATVRLSSMLSRDPLAAESWLEEHKDSFTADGYEKAKASVSKQTRPLKLEQMRDSIMAKFGSDEAAARKWILDNLKGEDEKDVWSLVRAQYADARRIRRQREADAYESGMNAVDGASSYADALGKINRSGLPASKRQSLARRAERRFGVGGSYGASISPEKYIEARGISYEYIERARSAETPEDRKVIAMEWAEKHGGAFTPSKQRDVIDKIMNPGRVPSSSSNRTKTGTEAITRGMTNAEKRAAKLAGFDPFEDIISEYRTMLWKSSGTGTVDVQMLADFIQGIEDGWDARAARIEKETGRKPTFQDMSDFAEDYTREQVIRKSKEIVVRDYTSEREGWSRRSNEEVEKIDSIPAWQLPPDAIDNGYWDESTGKFGYVDSKTGKFMIIEMDEDYEEDEL